MKILNLYAGLGGNRKTWKGKITAIEQQPDIAAAYAAQYPDDEVIVGDAHEYLAANFAAYDFIWASPLANLTARWIVLTQGTARAIPT